MHMYMYMQKKIYTLPYKNIFKLHWASKETYHFFRAMLTEIHAVKINNIWIQISFNTP